MDMRAYLNSITQAEREHLAEQCQTTVEYFWQLSGKHRRPSPALARRINQFSGGVVTLPELRPDIYGDPNQESAA
jgi:hypothetical protein